MEPGGISGHAEYPNLALGGRVCGLGAFARPRARLPAGSGDVRDPGAAPGGVTMDAHFADNIILGLSTFQFL